MIFPNFPYLKMFFSFFVEKKRTKRNSALQLWSSCVGLPSHSVFSGGVKNSSAFSLLKHLPPFSRKKPPRSASVQWENHQKPKP
jgi:hypothetical protein